MGLVDKFKKMISTSVEDEDEDDDDFVVYTNPEQPKREARPVSNEYRQQNPPVTPVGIGGSKIMNVYPQGQPSVVLVKPESFSEASSIADNINEKRTVVLNLESTNMNIARRLVDFLVGVAYANGATCKKVASKTFIFTPKNTTIVGDVSGDSSDDSMIF